MRLTAGQCVEMDDGWIGRVDHIDGQIVVAIRDGERPNDYLRGYRAFGKQNVAVQSGKAVVGWVARVGRAPRAVIDLATMREIRARFRVEESWGHAPN